MPWNNIVYLHNVNDKVRFLKYNIISLFDLHALYKTIKISRSHASWLTDNLKRISENWNKYKECRNFELALIRNEKTDYLIILKNDKKNYGKEINDYFISVFNESNNCTNNIEFI